MAAIWAGVLPKPEDDFGKAMADRAVVIDAREAEVLERAAAKGIEKPALGIGRVARAGGDVAEKLAKFGRIHNSVCRARALG